MARFLCQLCYTEVHYGERHPCFIYKSDDDFYSLPQLKKTEETDVRHKTGENLRENLNRNSEEISPETQEKDVEIPHEVISHLAKSKEHISLISSSKRKRPRKTAFPSKISWIDNGQINEIDSMNERHITLSEPTAAPVAGPSGIHMRSLLCSKEKHFVCNVCCKVFRRKRNFEEHYRTHTGDKPYVCGECGARFTQNSSLRCHIRIHTGDKPYVCGECGDRFTQSSSLRCHIRNHTGEKSFQCSVCGKRFARHSHLQDHFRIHTGEKPFNCKFCSQRFSTRSGLYQHCKKKHAEAGHSP